MPLRFVGSPHGCLFDFSGWSPCVLEWSGFVRSNGSFSNVESAFMLSRVVLICLANRLYKPFARKPWLNGLPRACTLQSTTAIRCQATGSMHRKFRNHENFQNIDAGEGFMSLKLRNSIAGAILMPAAPRPGWGPGPPRRRIEILASDFNSEVI